MKKYITLVFTALILASCADEKKETAEVKSDLESFKLNGPVKKTSEKSFKIENGQETPGNEIASAHNTDLIFDKDGVLVSIKQWMANGAPYQDDTYEGKARLIKKVQYIDGNPNIITENQWDKAGTDIVATIRRNPDNSTIDKIVYTFKNNRLSEKATYNAQDNLLDKIVYSYDKASNIAREDIYQGAGTLKAYVTYTYDKQGNKTSDSRFNADKTPQYKTNYTYENGKISEKITTNAKGQKVISEKLQYDPKENITMRTNWEHSENTESVEKYTYDKNNNVLTWSTESKGNTLMSATYTYDKNNNILTSKLSGTTGVIPESKSYSYDYDKQNNWIQKKIVINDKPSFIVKRSIKYHN